MAKELKLLGEGEFVFGFLVYFYIKRNCVNDCFLLLYGCVFTVLKSVRLSVDCNVRSRKIIYICDVFIKNLKKL